MHTSYSSWQDYRYKVTTIMVANIIKKLHIYSVNINRKAIVHLDCMLRL